VNLHDPALSPGLRHLSAPVRAPGPRHVTILLGLADGADFLEEQLNSIAAQTHADWSLIVGDDGSEDGSAEIVYRFAAAHPGHSIRLVPGPRAGFQRNFLALLRKVPQRARYVAFCDQDDVWLPEKLARAIAALEKHDPCRPALYGSRTCVTDRSLRVTGRSPDFRRRPSFRNALVQSIAGGNTMVMNRAACDLVATAAARTAEVISHDWWCYQVVSGAGGRMIFDREATVLYRQHGRNAVGAGLGFAARVRRLRRLLRGDFGRFTDVNLAALDAAGDLLLPENRRLVADMAAAREARALRRCRTFRALGLYRQTMAGSFALALAVALGRI